MQNMEKITSCKYLENRDSEFCAKDLTTLKTHDLYRLFYPRSVAFVGVSNNTTYGAASFMEAFKSCRYQEFGKIYPINPKYAGEILHGFKCHKSLASLPEPPDYVLCGIPANETPELLEQAIEIGVKFFILFTSGFNETGSDNGAALSEKVLSMLNSDKNRDIFGNKKLRIIGPNCIGIYNPSGGIAQFYDQNMARNGKISILSQSGGQASLLINFFSNRGHAIRMCASVGNMLDISISDILDFYRADPLTEVIICYIEGFRSNEGRRLISLIKNISKEKPVLIWKTGQTEDSVAAVSSHTGALAGNAWIFESAIKQSGAILTHSMEGLFDSASSLILSPLPLAGFIKTPATAQVESLSKGTRPVSVSDSREVGLKIGMVISGGGLSVEVVDTFSSRGLKKARFSPSTIQKIAEIIPDVNTFTVNPVDIGEQGYLPEIFKNVLELCAADKNVNFIVTARETERFSAFSLWFKTDDIGKKFAEAIKEVYDKYQKPIFIIVPNIEIDLKAHKERLAFLKMLRKKNIPSFSTVEGAAIAAASYEIHMKNLTGICSSG